MDRRRPTVGFVAALLLAGSLASAATEEPAPAAPDPPRFSAEQLDAMVAPVALYPDSLLMQVMIASTYPLELVEADRWRRQNSGLKDDALDKALEAKDWDPSVEGLTHFPELLKRMSDNLDWTKDLGDAFLGQKDDLLDAVQRMRRKAQESGALQTTKEQTVTKEVVNNTETIVVQPASPDVVYVPTYPPTAYGATYAPTYYPAPVYGYTGAQMATASLLSFGVGVGVGALISDGCDWGGHDVYVNNNYYGGGGGGGKGNQNVNVNVDKSRTNISNRQKWEHNPQHRRNVGYRDQRTTQQFERRDPGVARDRQIRDQARGYDRGGQTGLGSGQGMQRPAGGGDRGRPDRRGGDRPGGVERPSGGDRPGGARDRPAARPASGGRQDAFGSYGSGRDARQASNRGAASRGGQSWAGGGGGGGGRGSVGGGGRGGGGRGGGGRGGGGGRRR